MQKSKKRSLKMDKIKKRGRFIGKDLLKKEKESRQITQAKRGETAEKSAKNTAFLQEIQLKVGTVFDSNIENI